MQRGYFAGVATIGKNIVYLENRNGDSNVKFNKENILKNVYQILNSNDIKIKRSQVDCSSFTKAVIKVVEENSELLYIRAQYCAELTANTLNPKDNFKHVLKQELNIFYPEKIY